MLVIVDGDLSGMDAGAVWNDSKMGLSHSRGFDRIAVATDVGFFRAASRAFAPLMPCPVQVFAHADVDAARLWLRKSLGAIHAAELAPGTMELRLLGELNPDAYTRANEALAAHVTQGEEFRLLLDLREFAGWQGPAAMAAHLHTVMVSSDIRIWPWGDMKNWPTFMLMQLRFRASQRAFAKARCDVFRAGGSCRPGS